MPRKVRVNATYRFLRCGWDRFDRKDNWLEDGAIVRVINKQGCPPANTMGHCYVEEKVAPFRSILVSTASLLTFEEYNELRNAKLSAPIGGQK